MQDSAECHVFPVFWLNQNRLEIYLSLDSVTFSNLKDLPYPDVIVVIVPVAQICNQRHRIVHLNHEKVL